jgi:ribonuclease D
MAQDLYAYAIWDCVDLYAKTSCLAEAFEATTWSFIVPESLSWELKKYTAESMPENQWKQLKSYYHQHIPEEQWLVYFLDGQRVARHNDDMDFSELYERRERAKSVYHL